MQYLTPTEYTREVTVSTGDFRPPTPYSIRYPISNQETDNALVTSPESRVSIDSIDHLYLGVRKALYKWQRVIIAIREQGRAAEGHLTAEHMQLEAAQRECY
ncbi:hypothetical protein EVAR_27927_1 [Eumeta japonica]|uniref:Uncharacterized protein n=1 Tax=Eumeta variegata TaxID=151549 RepID=A0A4C1UUY3_EUMVA|nr:hypothetical protein EVAR_27927_1 [Eumeta japonica]